MDKKAINLMMETTIYIVLAILLFVGIYFSVSRVGSQAGIYEQIYAKQIALVIDNARAGTEVGLDIGGMLDVAGENSFTGNVINIDNEKSKVTVYLVEGRGYSFNYFNDADVSWSVDKDSRKLFLEVIENEE